MNLDAYFFAKECITAARWILFVIIFGLFIAFTASSTFGQGNVPPTSKQCSGTTSKGFKCTRMTKSACGLCWQHDKSSKHNLSKQAKKENKSRSKETS